MTTHRAASNSTIAVRPRPGSGWPSPAPAQQTPAAPVSAPLTNIRYEITFDSTTAKTRTLQVAMSFDVDRDRDRCCCRFPAWTPGAYELSFFARWVSNFTPTAGTHAR